MSLSSSSSILNVFCGSPYVFLELMYEETNYSIQRVIFGLGVATLRFPDLKISLTCQYPFKKVPESDKFTGLKCLPKIHTVLSTHIDILHKSTLRDSNMIATELSEHCLSFVWY